MPAKTKSSSRNDSVNLFDEPNKEGQRGLFLLYKVLSLFKKEGQLQVLERIIYQKNLKINYSQFLVHPIIPMIRLNTPQKRKRVFPLVQEIMCKSKSNSQIKEK